MTKTDLIQAIESAIDAAPTPEFGSWKVASGDSYVQLVWSCDADEAPEMYGDDPWSDHRHVDRFGDDVVSQWVEWRFEA